MTETTGRPDTNGEHGFLAGFAERLGNARAVRDGTVVLHFTDGGAKHLERSRGRVQVVEGAPPYGDALIEVFGSSDKIAGILSGEKDAVREFLAGGLRVRGDLGYLSDLGVELGVLRRPL
jgi:hypothetical protein